MKLPGQTQSKGGSRQREGDGISSPPSASESNSEASHYRTSSSKDQAPLNIVILVVGARGVLHFRARHADSQGTCNRISL